MNVAMRDLDRETRLGDAQFRAKSRDALVGSAGKFNFKADGFQISQPEGEAIIEIHRLRNAYAGLPLGPRLAGG